LNNLLIGGLESIESDKEGEDVQITLIHKNSSSAYKTKKLNEDLFESIVVEEVKEGNVCMQF
jgi:hypothetical protein